MVKKKQYLRDKIDSLKFKLNREDGNKIFSHNILIAFASLSLVIFIFELTKDVKSPFWILVLGITFALCVLILTVGYLLRKSKIEDEINKIYRELLKS